MARIRFLVGGRDDELPGGPGLSWIFREFGDGCLSGSTAKSIGVVYGESFGRAVGVGISV